jgi:hypothetical protein
MLPAAPPEPARYWARITQRFAQSGGAHIGNPDAFLSTRGAFRIGVLLLLVGVASPNSVGQQVHVNARVRANPAGGGWYPWYEIAASPTDANQLIVCGTRWDVRSNAFYGFVYSTSDSGKTWSAALEDTSSSWVTEQSCAFGADDRAYFVSEAAEVVDGVPSYKGGTTRIYVSGDAGRTWAEGARTAWADYSASAVDTRPGPGQNRLYTFFHDFVAGAPESTGGGVKATGSRVSVIAFKAGERRVESPIVNSKTRALEYLGSYPQKAFLLKDGSLLALCFARLKTSGSVDELIVAVRLDKNRVVLSDPISIVRSPINDGQACYPSDFAAAYDPWRDRVVVAYPAFENGQCEFVLKTSLDGGMKWSNAQRIKPPETMSQSFHSPAMAFGRGGILGLIWRDEPLSDCWYFSASSSDGETFSAAEPLSDCFEKRKVSLVETGASLRMRGTVRVDAPPASGTPLSGQRVLGLHLLDSRNRVYRNTGSLLSTADGVFHAVWIEAGHGEGELRTAAVTAGDSAERVLPALPVLDDGARDVTQDMALLYGGDQHYDISSRTLAVSVVLKNKSDRAVKAPLFIKALSLKSELPQLKIANASNRLSGPGARWDLTTVVPNGVLEAGATTRPFTLIFKLPDSAAPVREIDLLSLEIRVFACDSESGASHP